MKIGDRVKKLRKERKYSQLQVAEILGMDQSNYSKIERNCQELNIEQLKILAIYFDVTTDEIVGMDNVRRFDSEYCEKFRRELERVFDKFFN